MRLWKLVSLLAVLVVIVSGPSPLQTPTAPKPTAGFVVPTNTPSDSNTVGLFTVIGVKDSLNPLGMVEVTLRNDLYVMGPTKLRIEMRLPTGTLWREQTPPVTLRRNQHVRFSQR